MNAELLSYTSFCGISKDKINFLKRFWYPQHLWNVQGIPE